MAVKNNPVLGYVRCDGCGERASVHQTTRGAGRFLYLRCTSCGVDQRTGPAVQSRWWHGAEWLPGLKPEREPPNLLKSEKEPGNPGSEPKAEPAPEPKPEPVVEPEPEPDFVPASDDDEGGGFGALAMLGGLALGLLALATGRG